MSNQKFLYNDTPYKKEHEARIIAKSNELGIKLDEPIFYPRGGGQPGDTGTIFSSSFGSYGSWGSGRGHAYGFAFHTPYWAKRYVCHCAWSRCGRGWARAQGCILESPLLPWGAALLLCRRAAAHHIQQSLGAAQFCISDAASSPKSSGIYGCK